MGVTAVVGTLVGGLTGCEIGIAAGKVCETSDRAAVEAGLAVQGESPIKGAAAAGTLVGGGGGLETGAIIDSTSGGTPQRNNQSL